MAAIGAEGRDAGAEAREAGPSGFVLGLFFGEFRGDLVFPYPGPPEIPRRDGPVVRYCREMQDRFTVLEPRGPAAVAEGLEAWGRGLEPVGDAASFNRIVAAARLGLLAKGQLAGAVGRAVRGHGGLYESERTAAVVARLAAAAYAMEAATFEAAGWLERGVVDARTATAASSGPDPRVSHIRVETDFLAALGDRIVTPAALDAIPVHEPYGRAILDRPRVGDESAAWGLAAVGRAASGASGGLWAILGRRLALAATMPRVPVVTPMLRPFGEALGRRTASFGRALERAWTAVGGSVLARDGLLHHIGGAVVELAASACVLARIDASAASGRAQPEEHAVAELFLRESGRRFDQALRAAVRDPDREAVAAGRALLYESTRTRGRP